VRDGLGRIWYLAGFNANGREALLGLLVVGAFVLVILAILKLLSQ